jgi:hypothetical protein
VAARRPARPDGRLISGAKPPGSTLVDHLGIEEPVQVVRTAGHIARPNSPAALERLAADDLAGDVAVS